MQFIKALAFLATFTLALSAGVPVRVSRDVRSLANVEPATIRGEVCGHAYELKGTAESVWAQLKELYPEIELKSNLETRSTESTPSKKNQLPPICDPVPGQSWGPAYWPDVQWCFSYLNNLGGRYSIGPHTCQQICCATGQTVWLCNDNGYTIDPATPYLATYVEQIADHCQQDLKDENGQTTWWAGGQEFDTDNYNVIVKGQDNDPVCH